VRLLLEKGADVNTEEDDDGEMHWVSKTKAIELLE